MPIKDFQEKALSAYVDQAILITNNTVSWFNRAWGIEADKIMIQMITDMPVANYAKELLYVIVDMVRHQAWSQNHLSFI